MNQIKLFWKKGKWQKFLIICIIFIIVGFIGKITGLTYVHIDKVEVNNINLKIGESSDIETSITPENYEVEIVSIDYEIDDESIAKIDDKKIIGVSEGETTFKVIIKDNRDNTIKSNKGTVKVELTDAQKKEKEEAEKIAKRNKISTDEGVRIKDYCKQIIDSILKAPSTAEYPGSFLNPFDDWGMVKKNNLVTVSSYVDAQNSFGAMVRSKFIIQVKMDDSGSGKASYVEFDGKVISGKYQK